MAIKQKGVCDVCTKEFELNNGCFAIHIQSIRGGNILDTDPFIQITVTSIKQAGDNFKHVCGKACLHRMIDEKIDKGGEECSKE